MTTATLMTHGRMLDTEARPRCSLEELVDLLPDALFSANGETEDACATRSIHEARRLRQAGDVNVAKTAPGQARWAFSGWIRW